MTGDDFVKLCHDEKGKLMKDYFDGESNLVVSNIIKKMVQSGTDKKELVKLIDEVLNESFYTMLLGLDGECSLGDQQNSYKLYDEDGHCLNPCGELEESAYSYFMDQEI